ncbi:MAG: LuxR C-terminal-related transcriptional regulator [Aeromicrobium sp.]|uniref:helix-turn-helix transcriptional regulator n=1 Tax=Aeromicrobium sp. TaxID=1871063 RepID=UPI0039E32840
MGDGSSAAWGVVDRPRLYRLLDVRVPSICVVEGPSGCGKTTLLRSWFARVPRDHPSVWVTVDDNISTRHAFWRQVAEGARRLCGLGDEAVRAARGQVAASPDPVAAVVRMLAGAGSFTLVLDAYEKLGENARAVDDDLMRLVAELPEARVMVATRGNTTLSSDAVQLRMTSHVVPLREMAMTVEEVHELVETHLGRDDRALATSIAEATHGYALSVRAALLALSKMEQPTVDSVDWKSIVAADLESQLPDGEAARFLAATASAPYVDADLARRLTGRGDVEDMLDSLERSGFGQWIPHASGRPLFRYVESIREAFGRQAAEDPEREREAARATAEWLVANEEHDLALGYAVDGEAYSLAERIFLHLLMTNPESYLSERFVAIMRRVPEPEFDRHPLLAFALGAAMGGNPVLRGEATRFFERVVAAEEASFRLAPGFDRFAAASLRAVSLRLAARFRESARASLEAAALVDEIGPAELEQLGDYVATVLRQLSFSILQDGSFAEALAVMTRSAALCESQTTRNYSIAYVAGTHVFVGDAARGKAAQQTVDTSAWPEEFRQSYLNGMGLFAEGLMRLDNFDYEGALDVLRESSSYQQTAEFWPLLTSVAMGARLGLGQAQAEAERIEVELSAEIPPPGVGDNVLTEHVTALLSTLWLNAGDADRAVAVLGDQPEGSPHLAFARIAAALATTTPRAALTVAAEALELPGHTIRSRAATQTLGAAAALRADDPDLAAEWLAGAAVTSDAYAARAHLAYLADSDHRALLRLASERNASRLTAYLSRRLLQPGHRESRSMALSPRERQVLQALADFGTTREMAAALYVSPNTVKTQLSAIYRKFGVTSRAAALSVARELGLLDGE